MTLASSRCTWPQSGCMNTLSRTPRPGNSARYTSPSDLSATSSQPIPARSERDERNCTPRARMGRHRCPRSPWGQASFKVRHTQVVVLVGHTLRTSFVGLSEDPVACLVIAQLDARPAGKSELSPSYLAPVAQELGVTSPRDRARRAVRTSRGRPPARGRSWRRWRRSLALLAPSLPWPHPQTPQPCSFGCGRPGRRPRRPGCEVWWPL